MIGKLQNERHIKKTYQSMVGTPENIKDTRIKNKKNIHQLMVAIPQSIKDTSMKNKSFYQLMVCSTQIIETIIKCTCTSII